MDVDEFESYARELAYKSIHGFTLLGFSSLALSVQFSPQLGKTHLAILFISWILYLVSGLCGGWIIIKMPVFYKINVAKIRVEKHLDVLKKPEFCQAVKFGIAYTPDGKSWTTELLDSSIANESAKIELATKNMSAIEGKLPFVQRLQTWTYIFAIFLNLVFAMLNLSKC